MNRTLSALLVALACLSAASRSDAAAAHVQTYSATPATASSYTITGVNAGAGNYVTACGMARTSSGENITAVTFNGSGTGWSQVADSTEVVGTRQECWGASGLTGTADVVITYSASNSFGYAIASVWSGVNTSSPTGTPVAANDGGSGTLTIQDVVSDANSVVYAVGYVRGQVADTTASGTELYDQDEAVFGSTGVAQVVSPGTAATDVTWSGIGGNTIAGIGFSINGTGGGAPARPPSCMLLGVCEEQQARACTGPQVRCLEMPLEPERGHWWLATPVERERGAQR
jgi:hypothetical protein